MPTSRPRASTMVDLDPSECWAHLRDTALGRLAVLAPDGVDVFPVNYRVFRGAIYFRSAPGTKLVDLTAEPVVAFEADGADATHRWSVVVRGRAIRVADDAEIEESGVLSLIPDPDAEKHNIVRIDPLTVTGRRFRWQGGATSADRALADAVAEALADSRELDSLDVTVEAEAGRVTLAGRVGSHAERLAARSEGLRLDGVRAVEDDLEVVGYESSALSDGEIATEVEGRLAHHPELHRIVVSCRHHVVHLDGDAPSRDLRRLAHHLARTTPGVHFVIDRVAIGS